MRLNLPHTSHGQSIGLLGGSFDPPHLGHVHITHQALRRFHLDRVWWLVSPGNPLKAGAPADFDRRLAVSRALMHHPKVHVSDVEAQLGTRYTWQTLAQLRFARPDLRFVWLMGADNLAQFHKWDRWQQIIETVPLGVLGRPGEGVRGGLSPTARAYTNFRLKPAKAAALLHQSAPRWCLLTGPTVDLSSTDIRNQGNWVK